MTKNSVLDIIHSRRSVRRYSGKSVSREDMETLVRAGMAAPSSRDTRHWYFIVIDDAEMIKKLVDGLPYAKMLSSAMHAIIVASDLTQAHGGVETEYWVQDCSAAVENVLLAAQSIGIATCWTAAYPRPERVAFVKEVLGIPENVMPLCVIAVGYSAGDDKPRDKFDSNRIFWNKWDTK
jgi:nitroreductase